MAFMVSGTTDSKQGRAIINRIKPSLTQKIFSAEGGVILLLVCLLVLIRMAAAAASPPSPLDRETLTVKAIAQAQTAGLQGTPTAQRDVQMSLSEWASLIDAELGQDAAQFGLTPEVPVFVLAMRGNVEWRLPAGPPRPDQRSPEHYDNIIVVLNARTGDLMWVGSYRPGFPMPVPVP
jgi:hypothetical protein